MTDIEAMTNILPGALRWERQLARAVKEPSVEDDPHTSRRLGLLTQLALGILEAESYETLSPKS